MILVTWNVQWCRGVDGRVDPQRIVREARALADFDVLCLQEVADGFPHPRLAGAADDDQFARLASLLPGYAAIAGIAVDHPGEGLRRRRFGNLILSRLPVGQVFRHLLPYPHDPGVPGMPRVAIETTIEGATGAFRVVTTHLEYYSALQRMAQVEALRTIYADGDAHARDGGVTRDDGGPFQTLRRASPMLIAGDFNLEPDAPEYLRLLAPFDARTPATSIVALEAGDEAGAASPPPAPLADAWRALHPGRPHPTTFKLYEKLTPGEPELHCDFIFANRAALERIVSVEVDQASRASDHQPIVVTLT